ncbi:MerR family transcriptional regulator [Lacticaseibacillus pantheris]|uniref:MerR family transcriptional regulator n=1 Tax=Lacticaseibacillus pantheris TaxID=171523 RepID=UPI00265A5200|nr:MerR family transcriptional regulator [Lacticaseibacillus pantheris]WKF85319.1 MerR family transcriptional regulator [Lacticaseibacillus pantheris]
MAYSIQTVAQKTGLTISTLRFYDKAGLLPFVARDASGYRAFTDGDLALLHTIVCLKSTGMKITDIRRYIELVMAGPTTAEARRALLSGHRKQVIAKQQEIAHSLAEIDYKLAMYASPDAETKVAHEWALASADKEKNGLPNPFTA